MEEFVDMKVDENISMNIDTKTKEGHIVSDIIQLKLKELALKKKRRVLLEEIYVSL